MPCPIEWKRDLAGIGVMLPLIVSDITTRRGRFNLGMGIIGLAVGLGATLSDAVGGTIANRLGQTAALGVARRRWARLLRAALASDAQHQARSQLCGYRGHTVA